MVARAIVKRPLVAVLKWLKLYGLFQLSTVGGALRETGWLKSFESQFPIDLQGESIPWFTYPAIDFLVHRLSAEMRVFEYGCGASTQWWSGRVREVISCEHDAEWCQRMGALVTGNVRLHHIPLVYDADYCRAAVAKGGGFNIIVIDGRDRVNCARHAVSALTDDGVIIWDNSDRKEYAPGFECLYAQGFRQIPFTGMAPAIPWLSETSLFYRPDNCLGI